MNKTRFSSFPVCVGICILLTGRRQSFSTSAATSDSSSAALVSPGAIQGSNYGGHAPIVGAKVFLLQASSSGYGTAANSLLQVQPSSPTATQAQYPTSPDTSIIGTVSKPAYYVTTDATGAFNISGDYTCVAGLPVYIYAIGGAPDSNPLVGPSTLSSGTWSTTSGTTTFTFTVDNEKFYVGQSVTFSVYSGQTFSAFNGQTLTVTSVNPSGGSTLQNTQFSVVAPVSYVNNVTSGSGTFSGVNTVSPTGVNNPAIVNLAMLGNCPTSAPFTFGTGSSAAIPYIYMNEVSTVAAAFAMAPFAETTTISGTAPNQLVTRTTKDARYFSTSSTNLVGIENAAINASNLYDITGQSNNSSNSDGEAHVARTVLPGGGTAGSGAYGSVPAALINTLGNILAACVDSNNTAGTGVTGGSYSRQCQTLFTTATSDGTTTGTAATDTAAAAINIAHYPAGVKNANFMSNLYNLPGPIAPFAPVLSTQPNDFVIGINISDNAGSGVFLGTNAAPKGIAADSNGNVFVTTTGCTVGCTLEYSPTNSTGLVNPVGISYTAGGTAIAVSPSNQVWVVNATQTANGGNGPTGAFYVSSEPISTNSFTGYGTRTDYANVGTTGAVSIALAGNGTAYIADSGENYIHQITALGTAPAYTEYLITGQVYPGTGSKSGQLNCLTDLFGVAVDDLKYGYNAWTVSGAGTPTQGMCTISKTPETTNVATTATTPTNVANVLSQIGPTYTPGGVAVDMNGNGWNSNQNPSDNAGVEFGSGTYFGDQQYTGNYGFTGSAPNDGGLAEAVGIAVDGNDNLWFANPGTTASPKNSVTLFKNLGTAIYNGATFSVVATGISPTLTGYTASGQMSRPAYMTLDPSGDVWVTNSATLPTVGYSITELIGVAAPTAMPLSTAAGANELGMRP